MPLSPADIIQTKNAYASTGFAPLVVTFDAQPTAGNLILLCCRGTNDVPTEWAFPAGFSLVEQFLRSSETLIVQGAIAEEGGPSSFQVSMGSSGWLSEVFAMEVQGVPSDFSQAIGASKSSNSTTNLNTIPAGVAAISATTGSMVMAVACQQTADVNPTGVSDGFSLFTNNAGAGTNRQLDVATLPIVTDADYNTTFTYADVAQRRVSVIFEIKERVESSVTIDSVNDGAPIQSAQTGVPVVGTMLEQITAVRVVDSTAKEVDVTASWTGSGTSGTFNAPDFVTAGLKFGVIDVEFDWQ